MIQKPIIYADASLRMYGNMLMNGLSADDSMGNAGGGLESMVRNLKYNNELAKRTENRNVQIALAARESKNYGSYKARLSEGSLAIENPRLGYLKAIKVASETIAAFTVPALFIYGMVMLGNTLTKLSSLSR